VGLEVIWASLTYNIQTYIRLIAQKPTSKRPRTRKKVAGGRLKPEENPKSGIWSHPDLSNPPNPPNRFEN